MLNSQYLRLNVLLLSGIISITTAHLIPTFPGFSPSNIPSCSYSESFRMVGQFRTTRATATALHLLPSRGNCPVHQSPLHGSFSGSAATQSARCTQRNLPGPRPVPPRILPAPTVRPRHSSVPAAGARRAVPTPSRWHRVAVDATADCGSRRAAIGRRPTLVPGGRRTRPDSTRSGSVARSVGRQGGPPVVGALSETTGRGGSGRHPVRAHTAFPQGERHSLCGRVSAGQGHDLAGRRDGAGGGRGGD